MPVNQNFKNIQYAGLDDAGQMDFRQLIGRSGGYFLDDFCYGNAPYVDGGSGLRSYFGGQWFVYNYGEFIVTSMADTFGVVQFKNQLSNSNPALMTKNFVYNIANTGLNGLVCFGRFALGDTASRKDVFGLMSVSDDNDMYFKYETAVGAYWKAIIKVGGTTYDYTTVNVAADMLLHRFMIEITGGYLSFWIDDTCIGSAPTPAFTAYPAHLSLLLQATNGYQKSTYVDKIAAAYYPEVI